MWRAMSSRRRPRPRSSGSDNGETTASDGPLTDVEERLGGYFVVDCDLETAIAYASKIPAAEGGTIEVRPLVDDR